MTDAVMVSQCIRLLPNAPEELTAFLLENEKEAIIAAFNPGIYGVGLPLPEGTWQVCVNDGRADCDPLFCVSGDAMVNALSAFVAILAK